MIFLRAFLVLLVFAFPLKAFAQTTVSAEERKSIQDFQQNAYPSFVTGNSAPEPSPRATDGETTASLEARAPEVLVDDVQSTTTWMSARSRLQPALEELRVMMISSATPAEISEVTQKLSNDLERIGLMASAQAPLRAEEIARSLNRIDKQVEFVVDDYDARDFPRLQRSQELLQRSLEELEQTLRLSDEDRGRPYRAPADIPGDWNAGGFSSEDFAYQIRNMRARELLAAYQERVEMLSARQRNRRLSPSRDWETAGEMGEIARHLALRSSEVPIASQVPFRNAALRLDVLSESLGEYIRDGKDAYAKRHLRYARESLRTCLSYLAVREPGK